MQLSSTQKLGLSLSPDRDSQYFLIIPEGVQATIWRWLRSSCHDFRKQISTAKLSGNFLSAESSL